MARARPGGAIAGAIGYRHPAVAIFEGYAGTSESGFRAEVEAEEALLRGERLLAMADQREHSALTGPAAAEGDRRLSDFERNSHGFRGIVVTDRIRLRRLIATSDPAIYPGQYATCICDEVARYRDPLRQARHHLLRSGRPGRAHHSVTDTGDTPELDLRISVSRIEGQQDLHGMASRGAGLAPHC